MKEDEKRARAFGFDGTAGFRASPWGGVVWWWPGRGQKDCVCVCVCAHTYSTSLKGGDVKGRNHTSKAHSVLLLSVTAVNHCPPSQWEAPHDRLVVRPGSSQWQGNPFTARALKADNRVIKQLHLMQWTDFPHWGRPHFVKRAALFKSRCRKGFREQRHRRTTSVH